MTNEYKFFHEFFDGQIVKKESEQFKMFKILLFAIAAAVGFFAMFMKYSKIVPVILLLMGLLWNVYSGLSNKISNVYSVIVAFLYFYVACQFSLFANCLIYIGCYIPLQQIAVTKDYSEGDFIQIRKYINEDNKLILFIFWAALTICLVLFNVALGARFAYLDAISASFLVCSAILRNERYVEYYVFRFLGLIISIILWIMVAIEFGPYNTFAVIIMYCSYLVYDFANMIYQNKTYTNQFLEKQKQVKKEKDEQIIKEKLKTYEKMKNEK